MTKEDIIFWIAVYGAFTGTVALVWDYAKWKLSETHLLVRVQFDMKVVQGGEQISPGDCIFIAVENRGGKPTTIKVLGAEVYSSLWNRLRGKRSAGYVIPRPETGQPIPHFLDVGKEWTGWIHQTRTLEENSKQRLYIVVYVTTLNKPIRCRARRTK